MQIVVPAAGRGRRFAEAGFREPKPLVAVQGKPLIQWSTSGMVGVEDPRFVFLVLQEHIDEYGIDHSLRELYGGECEVIPVSEVTEGAASTVLLAKPKLNLEEPLAITNCDNLFRIDLGAVQKDLADKGEAALFYIAGNNPAWSYVDRGEDGYARRVAEKEVISDRAVVGCCYFRKAQYFIDAAEEMIRRNLRVRGEFYLSPVFNVMIERGWRVKTYPCDLHFSLGTPEELDAFSSFFFDVHISAIRARIPA